MIPRRRAVLLPSAIGVRQRSRLGRDAPSPAVDSAELREAVKRGGAAPEGPCHDLAAPASEAAAI
jgi:hypothetical protein